MTALLSYYSYEAPEACVEFEEDDEDFAAIPIVGTFDMINIKNIVKGNNETVKDLNLPRYSSTDSNNIVDKVWI